MPDTVRPSGKRWRRRGICLAGAYLLLIVVLAASLCWADDLPLPTLLAFGPRWMWAGPLLVLTPLAIMARSWWATIVLLVTAAAVAGPLAGGVLSPGTWFGSPPAYAQYRIVTWNGGGSAPSPASRQALAGLAADVVLLQENGGFAATDFPPGWSIASFPSGLLIASPYRFLPRGVEGPDWWPDAGPRPALPGVCARVVLDTPDGPLTVVDCHLPTVRPGLEAAIGTRFRDFSGLRAVIAERDADSALARRWLGQPSGLFVCAGDFNMPVESAIYARHWGDLRNAYSVAGNGWGGTKMTRWHRVRIDHVLYASPFRCTRAFAGPDLGSDHLPVIADLVLVDN